MLNFGFPLQMPFCLVSKLVEIHSKKVNAVKIKMKQFEMIKIKPFG